MKLEQIFSAYEAYAEKQLKLAAGMVSNYRSCLNGICSTHGGMKAFSLLLACKDAKNQEFYAREMLKYIPASLAVNYTQASKRAVDTLVAFINRASTPVNWKRYGTDQELQWIKYDPTIEKKNRVPKLCVELEEEYARIRLFAKGILGDMMDDGWFVPVPVLLTSRAIEPEIFEVRPNYLEQLRSRRNDEPGLNDEEEKILESGCIRYLPLGSYEATRNHPIEIYFRNTDGNNFEEYLAKLSNCLAHEYMHYLHYRYCEKLGKYDTYIDKDLSEGMADFFAFIYSIYRDGKEDFAIALNRYMFWTNLFESGFPYAKALCFCPESASDYLHPGRFHTLENKKSIKKLIRVLQFSNNKLDAIIAMSDKAR